MGYLDNLLDRVEQKVNSVINKTKSTVAGLYNGVVGNDDEEIKSAQKINVSNNVPNCVLNPKGKTVGTVGDMYNSKTNAYVSEPKYKDVKNKNKQVTQALIDAEIKALASKSNIAEETLKNELKGLSLEEQAERLSDINYQLKLYQKDKRSGFIASNVNEEAFVIESAKNVGEAKTNGVINNDKEAKKYHYIKRMKEALGKDFDTLSPEAQNERIEMVKNVFRQEIEADLYKKASPQRLKWIEAHKKKFDFFVERQLELAFLAVTNTKEEEAVRFRNGHDIAEAKELIFKIKTNSTDIADRMTADWDMEKLKYFKSLGQMPTAQEFGQGVKVSTSQMSAPAVTKYEQRFYEIKQSFYNGNPEYDFLTEDYYTEGSTAIGLGIITNVNMSEEEKADALKTWDTHAQEFKNDYDEVKRNLPKAALKRYIVEMKPSDKKTPLVASFQPAKESEKQKANAGQLASVQPDSESKKPKADAKQLASAILTLGFQGAKKAYRNNEEKEFVELIMQDPKLEGEKYSILGYIKSLPINELCEITNNCTPDMYCFTLDNVSVNKACMLHYFSSKHLCYDMSKKSENIIKKKQISTGEKNQMLSGENQKYAIS